MHPRRHIGIALGFTGLLAAGSARAQCPTGTEIEVDYDIPGSGYSEQSNNWTTWSTAPCAGAGYRYLSHTVGDGTREGKAIWRPAISHDGYWQFVTGYRATENRTHDADYWAYDDLGNAAHHSVDQTVGSGCQWVDLGTFYCQVGGDCRVELDGTDDSQSDCADVTIFRLVSCDDPTDGGAAGRCDGIRAVPSYEVCEETTTRCAGVFDDGSGCIAYCAAAGMTCTARYGGSPGCQQESANPIACDADNGHQSDWCECEGPAIGPDAGTGGAGGSTGAGGASTGGSNAGGAGTAAGGTAATGGTTGTGTPTATPSGAAPATSPTDEGGCGCRSAGGAATAGPWFLLLGLLVRRRRDEPRAARRCDLGSWWPK